MSLEHIIRYKCERCGGTAEMPGKMRWLPEGWYTLTVRPGAASKRNPATDIIPELEKSKVVCGECVKGVKLWWEALVPGVAP